jgi:hypothetical protein|tara:strand:+ start:528 stop:698 length:171 start_codon:yes stop_codon:yes gene_type:complete
MKKIKYPHHQQYRVDMALEKIQNIIIDCRERGADTQDMQQKWSDLLGAHHDMQSRD